MGRVMSVGNEYDRALAMILKARTRVLVNGHADLDTLLWKLFRDGYRVAIAVYPDHSFYDAVVPLREIPFLGEFTITAPLFDRSCMDSYPIPNAKTVAKVTWGDREAPIQVARLKHTDVAVIFTPDFTHRENCARAAAWLVQLVLTAVEDYILGVAERTKPLPPPYLILNYVFRKIEIPVAVPKIKNARCSDIAEFSIDSSELVIRVKADKAIEGYARGAEAFRLIMDEKPELHIDVTIRYVISGSVFKFASIRSNKRVPVTWRGRTYCHENIRDYDGNVCLGTYRPPDIKLTEEICGQVNAVAKRVVEILSMPEIVHFFQPCLVARIAEDPERYGARVERIEGEWMG